jgi:hypothetical protein
MDSLPKLTSILKQVIKRLRAIEGAVVDTGHAQTNAIDAQDEAYKKAKKAHPSGNPERIRTEVELLPKQEERYYAEQGKTYRLQGLTLIISFITLLVLAAYTYLTYGQWREAGRSAKAALDAARTAQSSLEDARGNFRKDQRPYIWLSGQVRDFKPGFFTEPFADPTFGYVVWPFHYTNYGRSPAYRVRYTAYVHILGVRPPDTKVSPMFDALKSGPPVPPNIDGIVEARSKTQIEEMAFQYMGTKGGRELIMFAVFKYADSIGGGSEYETGICLQQMRFHQIEYCDCCNYIK